MKLLDIRKEITFTIIAISLEDKVFYAQQVDKLRNIDYFLISDISPKDKSKLKKGIKFTQQLGYIDTIDGDRLRASKLIFEDGM